MTSVLDRLLNVTPNPLSSRFFLSESPLQLAVVVGLYVIFVKRWGPKMMKNRRPYELKGLIIAYNSFQVVINTYMIIKGLVLYYNEAAWEGECYKIRSDRPLAVGQMVLLTRSYCMMKVLDMLDTVFFVLRKRNDQVTFLHFYHHILMCAGMWLAFRYQPNSHGNMVGVINTIVHIVMYFYYLVASAHLTSNFIWWKKYITLLQIAQFVTLIIFLSYPLINGNDCGYPLKLMQFAVVQGFVMLALFIHFYIKAYILKTKTKTK